jgi:hypothetical protein
VSAVIAYCWRVTLQCSDQCFIRHVSARLFRTHWSGETFRSGLLGALIGRVGEWLSWAVQSEGMNYLGAASSIDDQTSVASAAVRRRAPAITSAERRPKRTILSTQLSVVLHSRWRCVSRTVNYRKWLRRRPPGTCAVRLTRCPRPLIVAVTT